MNKKAFTLVELIVVITILAILATIGFVSFSGYLAGTRDTNRIAQIKSMSDALELYRTKKDLPIPDDKVDVKSSGSVIAYQGYIGKNVLETIEYTESGLDPKDKNYFSYYLTKNKKYFQLMAFLEEENTDIVALNNFNKLNATDYSDRYPKTTGKKLGILTDKDNTPIQEISAITGSGYIDLYNVGTEEYKAIISDQEIISGTGTALASTNPKASCKRIKQIKGGSSDGVYTIDPESNGTGFKVYCDMTTDGGGWTLVANFNKEGLGYNSLEVGNINKNDIAGWKLSDKNINIVHGTHFKFEAQGIGNYRENLYCKKWKFDYSGETLANDKTICSKIFNKFYVGYIPNHGHTTGYPISHWQARDVWLKGGTKTRWNSNTNGIKDLNKFKNWYNLSATFYTANPDIKMYVK